MLGETKRSESSAVTQRREFIDPPFCFYPLTGLTHLLSLPCLEEKMVREMPEIFFTCSIDTTYWAKNSVEGAHSKWALGSLGMEES